MSRRERPALDRLQAGRIALIKPSALGDIVHTLPVLSAVRERFPAAHITWVVNRVYEPLLVGHPDLDATLTFDRSALKRGPWSALRTLFGFARALRQAAFDLVLDLQGLFRSGLMVWATGAPRRVGLSSSREGARWFYTDVIPVPDADRIHAVDRYWKLVEALGVGDCPRQFHLTRQPEAETWADQTLGPLVRPWVAVAAGARWRTKRWLPGHYQALLRRLQDEFGGTVLFVGGPEDRTIAAEVAAILRGPSVNLAGATTIPQLVSLLGRTDLMVGNDTGPLHVAAALGRPVVAPYTCTRVDLTGPFGATGGAVQTRVWCSGSLQKTCSRMECMSELTPDRLWLPVQEALQRWQVQRCFSIRVPPRATGA
jgi:lipopolysaccharide heptosyltransferase II